jgi:hypothetical protein
MKTKMPMITPPNMFSGPKRKMKDLGVLRSCARIMKCNIE